MNEALRAALLHPSSLGCGPIHLVSEEAFYDEDDLPFALAEGGSVVRLLPDAGFRKEALASTEDERLLIVDCPDGEGWIVPSDVVADWMARHVSCPALDDIILSHPLYEYLTAPDADGLSRGGTMQVVHWMPGVPTMARVAAPEFLPDDPEAPEVNRDPARYTEAVQDLLMQLREAFALEEVEVPLAFRLEEHPLQSP